MDKKILHELYVRYGKELYLYLYSICRSHATAEDLMQETFLKALLAMPDDIKNMRAWLYRVAKNLCFNYMNHHKKLISEEYLQELVAEDNILEQMIQEEDKRTLYRAMDQLSVAKREVLTLQYFVGLSQREIASILQLTPENVRILAFRAKKELQKLMEEME